MKPSQLQHRSGLPTTRRAGGNGIQFGPSEPLDRSYLLRRETRFPFRGITDHEEAIRLRRTRRVSASFSAIPPLARNGRS